jgi:hypothetical protein
MVAEKAADIIRGRPALHEKADVWLDDQWQERQRIASPARIVAID